MVRETREQHLELESSHYPLLHGLSLSSSPLGSSVLSSQVNASTFSRSGIQGWMLCWEGKSAGMSGYLRSENVCISLLLAKERH